MNKGNKPGFEVMFRLIANKRESENNRFDHSRFLKVDALCTITPK
jgi:hypothetical protein